MKKIYVVATMILGSLTAQASENYTPSNINAVIKEGVSVTVTVKSESGPV